MSTVFNSVETADAVATIHSYLSWLIRGDTDSPINVLVKVANGVKGSTVANLQNAIDYIASIGDDYQCLWASVQSLNSSAVGKVKITKNDAHAYRYLAVDVDSKTAHALKSCATDEERAKTLAKANEIDAMLQTYGLPRPLKVMSGNGSLLLYPIELPYTADSYSLMDNSPQRWRRCSTMMIATLIRRSLKTPREC